MSIKTAIKEHFENNPLKTHFENNFLKEHVENNDLKNHWDYFIRDNTENGMLESFHDENRLYFRNFYWEDLDACAELFKKVFSADPWDDDWKSLNQVRNYLNELTSNPCFEGFLVQKNSITVAVCFGRKRSWWMGKEFFVDEFFVANDQQGNGIGTKLMDFVTNSLLEKGYTRLTLLTNKEIPAERFYHRNGFYNNFKRTVMVKDLQ
jgi:aminoglycoside 6'-N-acetyltransferase I